MTVRTSPAVRYPVQHSRALRRAVRLVAAGGAGLLGAWSVQGAGQGWAQLAGIAAGAAALTLAVVCAERGLARWPQGELVWGSGRWTWVAGMQAAALPGAPQVVLDVQWGLALRWPAARANFGMGGYVWVVRSFAPAAWGDLRRAVYSPAPPASQAVAPPTAPTPGPPTSA